jgi:hypothetical protein
MISVGIIVCSLFFKHSSIDWVFMTGKKNKYNTQKDLVLFRFRSSYWETRGTNPELPLTCRLSEKERHLRAK